MKRRIAFAAVCLFLVGWSVFTPEQPVHQRDTSEVPEGPLSSAFGNKRTSDRLPTSKGDLVVSPLDHASILLGWDGKAIYVDPTSPAIEDEKLPTADVVLVTEARFEHFDGVALERLRHPGTVVVAPASVASQEPVEIVMNDGDVRDVGDLRVTAVPIASTLRGPAPGLLYHPRGRDHGYVLEMGGLRVYVSGDTECTPEMKALTGIDAAFVAVGPPWAMTPDEAAACVAAFRPKILFPYHDWHTDLTAVRALAAQGIDVRVRDFYPRAERWRRDAVTACEQHLWGICRDRLELARLLDPESEKDPRVIHAREQVRAWQSPFPPWW
jgi:L-ascorbate metabolism protein UlaG (beta-lactamase superfamily)